MRRIASAFSRSLLAARQLRVSACFSRRLLSRVLSFSPFGHRLRRLLDGLVLRRLRRLPHLLAIGRVAGQQHHAVIHRPSHVVRGESDGQHRVAHLLENRVALGCVGQLRYGGDNRIALVARVVGEGLLSGGGMSRLQVTQILRIALILMTQPRIYVRVLGRQLVPIDLAVLPQGIDHMDE